MNQNYQKTLNKSDFEELFTIYDIIRPKDIPGIINGIIDYLENSYKVAIKVRSSIKPLEIGNHIELLKDLHSMAEDMLTLEGSGVSLYHQKYDFHIRVSPLSDFISMNANLDSIITDMNIMLNTMRNYANAQNIEQYKIYADFVEMLAIVLGNIDSNHRQMEIRIEKTA